MDERCRSTGFWRFTTLRAAERNVLVWMRTGSVPSESEASWTATLRNRRFLSTNARRVLKCERSSGDWFTTTADCGKHRIHFERSEWNIENRRFSRPRVLCCRSEEYTSELH